MQLRDFCSFVQGGRLGLTKQDHYRSSGVPAFSAAGQDGCVDVVEFRDTDAVILSAIGANCGRCFLATGNWTTLANVQVIIPRPSDAIAPFLHYRVNRDDYWPRSGSAQPFIKPSDIRSCWVALPPVPQQAAIAKVLDTLDTAIHETEAIIAKLKAVKQGLLHDLLTRGIDANGELRPPQAEAPHLYKPSPLGWIPKEWQVAPLSSRIASLDAGVSVNSEDRPHGAGEIGVLKTSALSQGKFLPDQNKAVVASEISLVREPVLGDSILVSRMNTPELVGESCYVSMPWPTLFLPDRIWQLKKRSPETVDMQWLTCVFLTPYYRAYVQMHATGTSGSMKNLPKSRLLAMPVAFPGTAEQSAIAALVDAADNRIATEASALEKLRAQKSGLMDDLLTGRVRVTPLLTTTTRGTS